VLVAINLRPAAASLGPVLGNIQSSQQLSSGWAGLLSTLPVLCFGLLGPLAPLLARRLGLRRAIAAGMWLLLAGELVRLLPGVALLFTGTAVAGSGIAIGNVLVPVLVRRHFPERTGPVMALYSTSLIGFAALAAGLTVPLANALGGGWRPGLAVWAIPAAVAALAWLPAVLREPAADVPPPGEEPAHTAVTLLRHPLAWQVTLFFALQSGSFYATLAWLPSIFRSHGASPAHAGLLLSLSMVVGVVTALATPWLATRRSDQRALMVACCLLIAAGFAGILVAPMSAPYLWVILLGLGQNASFPLALMLIVLRAGSVGSTEGLSTLSQSVGYALAALAPFAVGALHGATGSWDSALILLLVLVVPQLVLGWLASLNRQLAPRASAPSPAGSERGEAAARPARSGI
jgi:CP family cyanate transporter-like MFS transporter